ncbi:MAG: right-handed parallel beta-helix repeat-containing protein [Methanobacteriaceae archaeon]
MRLKKDFIKIVTILTLIVAISSMVVSPTFAESLVNGEPQYKLANDDPTRFSIDNITDYIINSSGSKSLGINAIQMNNISSAAQNGVGIITNAVNGEMFIGVTGGVGWVDDIVLFVSVNRTIPENFKLTLAALGFTWDPIGQIGNPNTNFPLYGDIAKNVERANISLDKNDFNYNSTWRPSQNPLSLYNGGNISDLDNMFYSAFVDMDVGALGVKTMSTFTSEQNATINNYGMSKIAYAVENLPKGSSVIINVYGWTSNTTNIENQFTWTNNNALTYIIHGLGTTHQVNNSMSTSEIQEIIDNSVAGDLIKFTAGTYTNLALKISKSVELVVDGIVNIVRDEIGTETGTAFDIRATNVNISGFNIENYVTGINLLANNSTINNNSIKDTDFGINGSSNGTIIHNNTVNESQGGITLNGSNNNVTNNTVVNVNSSGSSTEFGYGIRTKGDNNTIANNTVSNVSSGNPQRGTGVWDQGHNNLIENNSVDKSYEGIQLAQGENRTIRNNTVSNIDTVGISVKNNNVKNVLVEKNTVKDSSTGIATSGNNVTVKNNKVSNSKATGIHVTNTATKTKIQSNSVSKSNNSGIRVNNKDVEISNNIISNEKIGVDINITGAYENVTVNNNNFISTNAHINGLATINSYNNITVDNKINSTDIQAIINNLNASSDKITFQNGTYENIFLTIASKTNIATNGTVIFKATGTNTTVTSPGFNITNGATNQVLTGFTIDSYKYGIINEAIGAIISKNIIKNSSGYGIQNKVSATITGNTISQSNYGIYDTSTTGTTINTNNINTNKYGIYLCGANTIIDSNIITKNTNYGIYNTGNYNKINKNTISQNNYGIYNTGKATITTNTINTNNYGIYDQSTGTTINNKNNINNNKYGIYLKGAKAIVESNTISKNTNYGIYVEGNENKIGNNKKANTISSNKVGVGINSKASKNNIAYNTISGNTNYGIYNLGSYTTTTRNTIKSSKYGAYTKGSKNTISYNTISGATTYGIYDASSYGTLTKNTLSSNKYGIYNKGASKTTISYNKIKSNKETGLYVIGKYVKMVKNTISGNKVGIYYLKKTNSISGNTVTKNKKNIIVK